MNRILFEPEEVVGSLAQDDPRARHIDKVLRAREGDTLAVGIVNGPRGVATYRGVRDGRHRLDVAWEAERRHELLPLVCLLGHPRPIVLKRVVRELTTAAVGAVVVCGTELGEKSYLKSNVWHGDRLRSCLVEGASQAGGTCLPALYKEYSVRRGIAAAEAAAASLGTGAGPRRYLFSGSYPGAESACALFSGRRRQQSVSGTPGRPIIYAVGSERGFTDAEQAELVAAGFKPLTLGRRIFRTESAATAAAVLFQCAAAQPPA